MTPLRARDPPLPHGDADRVRLSAVRPVAVLPRDRLARLRALHFFARLDTRRDDGPVAGYEERNGNRVYSHAGLIRGVFDLRGSSLRRQIAGLSRVLFVLLADEAEGCKRGKINLKILI